MTTSLLAFWLLTHTFYIHNYYSRWWWRGVHHIMHCPIFGGWHGPLLTRKMWQIHFAMLFTGPIMAVSSTTHAFVLNTYTVVEARVMPGSTNIQVCMSCKDFSSVSTTRFQQSKTVIRQVAEVKPDRWTPLYTANYSRRRAAVPGQRTTKKVPPVAVHCSPKSPNHKLLPHIGQPPCPKATQHPPRNQHCDDTHLFPDRHGL
jgi:hypothetical protein